MRLSEMLARFERARMIAYSICASVEEPKDPTLSEDIKHAVQVFDAKMSEIERAQS